MKKVPIHTIRANCRIRIHRKNQLFKFIHTRNNGKLNTLVMTNHPWNVLQSMFIDKLFFTIKDFIELFTSYLSNVVITLYPISIFIKNFMNKYLPSSSPYHRMIVFRVSISLFKPLKVGFLFQSIVFKHEKLDVLWFNFMKYTSIWITLVNDVIFFSFVHMFVIHPKHLENIKQFFLRPNTKSV